MKPDLFLADLLEKPARLRELDLDDAWGFVAAPRAGRCCWAWAPRTTPTWSAAARLRAAGVPAVAELASSPTCCPPSTPDTLVIAVSASAGSVETLDAVDRLGVPFVALANKQGPLTERASARSGCRRARSAAGSHAARSSTPSRCCWPWSPTWLGAPLPPVADGRRRDRGPARPGGHVAAPAGRRCCSARTGPTSSRRPGGSPRRTSRR